jgi:predicted metal-binding protein
MSGRIFVCITCHRDAPVPAGQATPGLQLAHAMKRHAAAGDGAVVVRMVECLNGCPHPCAAALRMPGKMVIRFAHLTTADAPALLEAAALYADSPDGDVTAEALPAALRGKVADRVRLPAA